MSDMTYGPAFDENLDGARIRFQLDVIREVLKPGEWWTLDELAQTTGYPPASISAQLRHLRKERFGSYTVDKRRHSRGGGLWEYRLDPASGPRSV